MTDENQHPMTDEEFDELGSKIERDMAVARALNDSLIADVRRYRAEERRRRDAAPGTVHHFPIRPSGDGGE
jgi:hypothetical protein